MKPRLADLAETNASLWILAASPVLWSLHFLVSYGAASIWCGRLGAGSIDAVRVAFAIVTFIALIGIAAIGFVGFGWQRAASGPPPHDADTPEDRRGFMGLATVLLSGLSGVGVIYSALAAVFSGTCQ